MKYRRILNFERDDEFRVRWPVFAQCPNLPSRPETINEINRTMKNRNPFFETSRSEYYYYADGERRFYERRLLRFGNFERSRNVPGNTARFHLSRVITGRRFRFSNNETRRFLAVIIIRSVDRAKIDIFYVEPVGLVWRCGNNTNVAQFTECVTRRNSARTRRVYRETVNRPGRKTAPRRTRLLFTEYIRKCPGKCTRWWYSFSRRAPCIDETCTCYVRTSETLRVPRCRRSTNSGRVSSI